MTGNPIGDGYGGFIDDGYSGEVDDGYGASGVPSRPSRLSRIIAGHFSSRPYPGRAARRVTKANPPLPPVLAKPSGHQAVLRAYIAHFDTQPYKGRRQNRFLVNYGGGTNNPPRASQVVAEALNRNPIGARASQTILEALARDPGPVRASQVVVESLYQSTNPAQVRASQIVVEALVPYLELPVIPVYPELPGLQLPITKRPKWSTGVGTSVSGREVAIGYWSKPQWEWDLSYSALNDNGQYYQALAGGSDIKELIGFFLSTYGCQAPFFFRDPDDCTQIGTVIGTGDGVTTNFLFIRNYGVGAFSGSEPVGGVNDEETLTIYLNGVPVTTGFTLNTSTPCGNYVQFTTPPSAGAVITADFSFWYFCRFKDDTADFDKFAQNLWSTKGVTIFSLKN